MPAAHITCSAPSRAKFTYSIGFYFSGEASEGESEDHDGDEEEVEGQKTSKVMKKSKTKHEKAHELKR